jgi:hypothetical protein
MYFCSRIDRGLRSSTCYTPCRDGVSISISPFNIETLDRRRWAIEKFSYVIIVIAARGAVCNNMGLLNGPPHQQFYSTDVKYGFEAKTIRPQFRPQDSHHGGQRRPLPFDPHGQSFLSPISLCEESVRKVSRLTIKPYNTKMALTCHCIKPRFRRWSCFWCRL